MNLVSLKNIKYAQNSSSLCNIKMTRLEKDFLNLGQKIAEDNNLFKEIA